MKGVLGVLNFSFHSLLCWFGTAEVKLCFKKTLVFSETLNRLIPFFGSSSSSSSHVGASEKSGLSVESSSAHGVLCTMDPLSLCNTESLTTWLIGLGVLCACQSSNLATQLPMLCKSSLRLVRMVITWS